MAGRYHKTPFQNSTPVLASFWRRQPLRAKSMLRASPVCKHPLTPYLYARGTPPTTARIPVIIQYLYRLLVCSRGAGAYPETAGKPFPSLPVENKFALFSTFLSLQASSSPVLSERVLPFQCRESLVGLGAAPGVLAQGPTSLTICKGFTRALSTVRPQWRCGPVTRPVAPTFPSTSPASRISPTFALISDRCP